jgi:small subunit ribosomal protein S9
VSKPFVLTDNADKFDVVANLHGGGVPAQAWALGHGIAKALLEFNSALRTILKRQGLITRDPRVKERKKYGQRAARARFQFSKR